MRSLLEQALSSDDDQPSLLEQALAANADAARSFGRDARPSGIAPRQAVDDVRQQERGRYSGKLGAEQAKIDARDAARETRNAERQQAAANAERDKAQKEEDDKQAILNAGGVLPGSEPSLRDAADYVSTIGESAKGGWDSALASMRADRASYDINFGADSPEARAQRKKDEGEAEDASKHVAAFGDNPLAWAAGQIGIIGGSLYSSGKVAAETAAATGAAGAAVGAAATPEFGGIGAIPGAVAGAAAGFTAGFAADSYRANAGQIAADLEKDGDVSTGAVRTASVIGGGIMAALDLASFKVLSRPFRALLSSGEKQVAEKAFQSETSSALKQWMQDPRNAGAVQYLEGLGTETLTETLQQGVQDVAEDTARQLSGSKAKTIFDDPDRRHEVVMNAVNTALTTAVGMAGVGVPGAVVAHVRRPTDGFREPTAPGHIEEETAASQATPDDLASPLSSVLDLGHAKTAVAGARGKLKADEIMDRNIAPPTGTMVEFAGKRWTVEDAGTDENGEDFTTISHQGQKQKVYFKDLNDAGETLTPIADPRETQPVAPLDAAVQQATGEPIERPTHADNLAGAGATLKARIKHVESHGDPNAKNPNSSASGTYQFTNDTFDRYYRKVYGTAPTADVRNDPAVQERLMNSLVADNTAALTRAGFEANAGNLYLAHFLGAGGATSILRNPNGSAEAILGEKVAKANASIIRGKTGAELAAWASRKMSGARGAPGTDAMAGADPVGHFEDGTPTHSDSTDFLNDTLPDDGSPLAAAVADAAGPTPEEQQKSFAAKMAELDGKPAEPPTRPLYRGVPENADDNFRAHNRGPLGAGVYMSGQPGVAAQYGKKVVEADVTGHILDGVRGKVTPEFEQAVTAQMTPDEQSKFKRWSTPHGVGDFVDQVSRSVESHRIPEIFGALGYHGIEANVDGHEVSVFDPKNIAERAPPALDDGKGTGTQGDPRTIEHAGDLELIGQHVAEPTEAQAEANNYQKAHADIQGLKVSIENPAGSTRKGTDAAGNAWETTLPAAYGYIRKTEGGDGEHFDVYVGPNPQSPKVYVVDQFDPKTGKWDEHKGVLGADSREQAIGIYDAGFSDGSGPKRRGTVTEMSVDDFKAYLAGDTTKPAGNPSLAQSRKAEAALPAAIAPDASTQAAEQPVDLKGNTAAPESISETTNAVENIDAAPQQTDAPVDFDAHQHVEALQKVIANKTVSLSDTKTIARRLGLSEPQATAVMGALASRPKSGVRMSKSGKLMREPTRTAPVSLMEWVRAQGGIHDPRHDLRSVGALARHPGIISSKGMSIDALGERMHEHGWFHGDRPSEAQVLDLLDRGSLKKTYRAEDTSEVMGRDEEIGSDEEDRYRGEIERVASEAGFDLNGDEVGDALRYVASGETIESAVQSAIDDAAARSLHELHDATGDPGYGAHAEAVYEGEHAEQRDSEAAAGVAGQAGPEGSQSGGRAPDAQPDRGAKTQEPLTDLLGKPVEAPAAKPETAAAAAPDMFGTRPGDQRTALERKGEGRQQGKAAQKAAGSEGGIFDTRDTTGDLLAAKPAEPIAQARAALQQAMEALDVAENRKPETMIEDAGEKIGGARKDRWAERGMDVSDLEGMSQGEAFQLVTKDAVWPKPDYGKMVADGVPAEVAAGIKLLRDGLAAKPRVDSEQGRRDYVEMMGAVRHILADVRTMDDFRGTQKAFEQAAGFTDEVRRDPVARKAGIARLFSIIKGNTANLQLDYADRRKAAKMVEEGFPEKGEPWKRRFEVRQWGGGTYRVRGKGKTGRSLPESYASREEAEAAAKAAYEALSKNADGTKKAPERPHLDEIARTGEDVRGGRDIDSHDFIKDFGFRGIEYGNWVAGDERQKSTNLAYEALHDLANTLGIPPRALSLGGQLGLAFGARGTRFAAHYEPGKLVINLTKMNGAGALAHEWGHALDHYFGTLDTDLGTRGAPKGASGWYDKTPSRLVALGNLRPEMAQAFDKLMATIFTKDQARAQMVRDAELRIEKLQAGIAKQRTDIAKAQESDGPHVKKFVKQSEDWIALQDRALLAAGQRLADLTDETKPITAAKVSTSYYQNATALSGKQGSNGYWARPTELLARSFESYVFDKIGEKGNVSQYLVQGVEDGRYAEGYAGDPYPAGPERQAINAAYDDLFKTMQVRDEGEEKQLYSLGGSDEAAGLEPISDSVAAHSQLFTDQSEAETFRTKGLRGLDVPSQVAVLHQVFMAGQDHEILDAIVRAIPVPVMDVLTREQIPPHVLFHDEAMLQALPSVTADHAIPSGIDIATALVDAAADAVAEQVSGAPNVGRLLEDAGATLSAGDDGQGVSPDTSTVAGEDEQTQEQINATDAAVGASNKRGGLLAHGEGLGPRTLESREAEWGPRLRAALEHYGVADRILLRLVANLENRPNFHGSYYRRVITVALESGAKNPLSVFNHEVVHALRALNVFKPAEWAALVKEVNSRPELMADIRQRYAKEKLSDMGLEEEAIADLFRDWTDARKAPKGFLAAALQRVKDLIHAVTRAFSDQITTGDVFHDIESGKIGRRPTGAGSSARMRPQYAAGSITDTPAFKRWFGDSKVVDENGEPLVVYHGGTSWRTAPGDTWTTDAPHVADGYADQGFSDPEIKPLYVKMENPLDLRDPAVAEKVFGEPMSKDRIKYEREPSREAIEYAKQNGYDGVIHPDTDVKNHGEHTSYITFKPSQLKAAQFEGWEGDMIYGDHARLTEGNSGTFDPADDRIMFSIANDIASDTTMTGILNRTQDATGAMKLPTTWDKIATAVDDIRTAMQDRMLPGLRAEVAAEKVLGRKLTEAERPYMQEELMTGRVGAALERLTDDLVEPLFDTMREEKVNADELDTFLYARHAPERNAHIAKINPQFAQGEGSGMTDLEAKAIMARIAKAGRMEAFERVAAKVDAIRDFNIDYRVQTGLMSKKQAAEWKSRWKYYAPLKGFSENPDGDARPQDSKGISVRGAESKQAFGRRSAAADLLAHTIMQAEEGIVRGQKNLVGQAFYKLAQQAKDKTFWRLHKVAVSKRLNKDTGLVENHLSTDLQPGDEPYTVFLKIDGEHKRVTMMRGNQAAERLAAAMRRLDDTKMNGLIKLGSTINRYLSAANTSLNPEFVISNAFRDIEEASVNLSGFDVKGLKAGTLKDYPAAMKASMKGAFKKDDGGEWAKAWREFTDAGGRVFYNQIQDVGELRKDIEKRMTRSMIGATGKARTPKEMAMLAKGDIAAVFHFIENVNLGVENAIRLSAFKNARQRGMTASEAASLAKSLTINFNKHGAWGVGMNAAYLFYNASVQGTARILTAMKHKKVRRVVYGMMLSGLLLDMLNRLLSDDDKDGEKFYDKISDFEKSRNLIVMNPAGGSRYLKIPLPYGYNSFFAIGRGVSELIHGKDFGSVFGNMAGTIVDAFNPIGGTQSIANFIAPTVLDPAVDLERNRDYADRPIMPDQPQFGPGQPDNQRYWGSVGPQWKAITDFLNTASGGDKVVPGKVDVSPETLEYLFGVVTGAAGSFVDRVAGAGAKVGQIVDGNPDVELSINDIPMGRKLIGEKAGYIDKAAFYARLESVETAVHQGKEYIAAGDREGLEAFKAKEADVLHAAAGAKQARKEMRLIRKERRALDAAKERGRVDDDRYKEVARTLKQRETRVIDAFDKFYLATVKDPVGAE